jgi:hypothetical protein
MLEPDYAMKSDLHLKLWTIIDKARRDSMLFAIATVILTPFFVSIAVFVLLFFVLYFVDLPVIDHPGFAHSFATGTNFTLTFMVASFFLRPKASYRRQKRDATWIIATLALLCVLFVFSYATPLLRTHPFFFWIVYLFFH